MTFFFQYLKGLRRVFFAEALFALLFIASFLLYHLPLGAVLYPLLLCGFVGVVLLAFDFSRVWREHTCLQRMKTIADAAVGPFPPCRRTADADYQALISLLCAEHSQYKIETDGKYEDMIDYYTVWAHQIKTPLAAMRLHLQNEDSPLSRQLMLNLHRVEQYVEMVLTFLRLNAESTDYVIREQDLDGIVRQAVSVLHPFLPHQAARAGIRPL